MRFGRFLGNPKEAFRLPNGSVHVGFWSWLCTQKQFWHAIVAEWFLQVFRSCLNLPWPSCQLYNLVFSQSISMCACSVLSFYMALEVFDYMVWLEFSILIANYVFAICWPPWRPTDLRILIDKRKQYIYIYTHIHTRIIYIHTRKYWRRIWCSLEKT